VQFRADFLRSAPPTISDLASGMIKGIGPIYAKIGSSQIAECPRDAKRQTEMVTGDPNAALIEWVVQYRVSDPVKLFLRFGNRAKPSAMNPDILALRPPPLTR
jgi:hypothetical protein